MTVPAIPLCASCTRLGPKPDGDGVACAAFPKGIPDDIWLGGFDHRNPHPGDGGVRFELAPGEAGSLAAYETRDAAGAVAS